jgi:hypothetical protein
MSQRLSKPSGYNRRLPALNAVVKLSLASGFVEPVVQVWHLIVLHAEVLLLLHQDSVETVVPG